MLSHVISRATEIFYFQLFMAGYDCDRFYNPVSSKSYYLWETVLLIIIQNVSVGDVFTCISLNHDCYVTLSYIIICVHS